MLVALFVTRMGSLANAGTGDNFDEFISDGEDTEGIDGAKGKNVGDGVVISIVGANNGAGDGVGDVEARMGPLGISKGGMSEDKRSTFVKIRRKRRRESNAFGEGSLIML